MIAAKESPRYVLLMNKDTTFKVKQQMKYSKAWQKKKKLDEKVGLILGMQRWFNITKPTSIIHFTEKLKDRCLKG